ncbi:DUF4185 domain-containing protein [Hoyosella rhizosphaerae]|uniref:DUF4185 domain-containing protein n=1 Tax=Hoyosella rhizosphaerae TaxID=1755582 RepID=A0A916UF13_9ACTN|nr:DUF4185 domain-containing protein [Hoyosella rhizosphaerae]GGC68598.1 hypothetical protein GCM10011410_21680 [Hoyosella rhizosphaerae]
MQKIKAVPLGLASVLGAGMLAITAPTALAAPCASISTSDANGTSAHVEGAPLGRMPETAHGPVGLEPPHALFSPRAASPAKFVEWLTGPNSNNQTPTRFGMSGTDLGIIWDNGKTDDEQQVLIAYGDTFGDCSLPGNEWRFNALMRSADTDLSDGMAVPDPLTEEDDDYLFGGSPVTIDRPDFSKQIIDKLGLAPTEFTVIPTAGIAVGTTQYINFMSVKEWGPPGQWTTNFSAIAVSDDNGENWDVDFDTIRADETGNLDDYDYVAGNNNFQMAAYVKRDGYVYTFGTPSGRQGAARVARVNETDILDLAEYEYWNGSGWTQGDPSAAVNVIPARVSEMSVQWNEFLGKYIALYTNSLGSVVLRLADQPQGPWSDAEPIMTATAFPGGLYAPYIHPWSEGSDLYFTVSRWSHYNVMLMRTTLDHTPPTPGVGSGSMGGGGS